MLKLHFKCFENKLLHIGRIKHELSSKHCFLIHGVTTEIISIQ